MIPSKVYAQVRVEAVFGDPSVKAAKTYLKKTAPVSRDVVARGEIGSVCQKSFNCFCKLVAFSLLLIVVGLSVVVNITPVTSLVVAIPVTVRWASLIAILVTVNSVMVTLASKLFTSLCALSIVRCHVDVVKGGCSSLSKT